MITDRDIKALKGVSGTQHKLLKVLFIVIILFQEFCIYREFSLAVSYGQATGLNIGGILEMWNAEPELQREYSSYQIQSLIRLNEAIYNVGIMSMFIFFAVHLPVGRSRYQRISEKLTENGAI